MSERIRVTVDGTAVEAFADEPLGAVLHRLRLGFRRSPRRHEPRGLFCGMGVCFECAVRVDGADQVRACITPARDGMVVETGA